MKNERLFARIGVWEGSADDLDGWAATSVERVAPAVRAQPGNRGALFLRDRVSGRALTITLWESEGARDESEGFRRDTQAGTTAASGARSTTERYEVVTHFQTGEDGAVPDPAIAERR